MEYYDGKIVSANDIIRDFIIDSRNEYMKRTSYYSKDKLYTATIYDDCNDVIVERNE